MQTLNELWFEISNALEVHHAIFYKIWQMGKPMFTEEIDTAAVQFDKEGKFFIFLFNQDFWNSLDFENKLFVICHESLHVILNHGIRIKDSKKNNRMACNQALDIVVNHLLVDKFAHKRENIKDWENFCWIDTIFPGKNISTNESYEFYYNLFEKSYGDGGPGTGNITTVDDHSYIDVDPKELFENLDLSEEEKSSLKDTLSKHAGNESGDWELLNFNLKKRKQKWESVIKKWSVKSKKNQDEDTEQWIRLNRRMEMLSRDMFLPSDMEVECLHKDFSKTKVYFFMDTSGSCWHLKDRFFSAASSLSDNHFDVSLFCFDTKVFETTLESKKVYGGAGTSFSILEKYIQSKIKDGEKYPDGVFVITDGYGDNIYPEKPTKWHWFLTDPSVKNFIPKLSKCYKLSEFE